MGKLGYETVSRTKRIAQLRHDGLACAQAGYAGLAEVCFELADTLADDIRRSVEKAERREQRRNSSFVPRSVPHDHRSARSLPAGARVMGVRDFVQHPSNRPAHRGVPRGARLE